MTITPREWLRGLPKCELHLHLEGTIVPETLVKLSQRHDAEPLTLEAARALYVYDNFLGFLMAFKAVSERLQTPEDYERTTVTWLIDAVGHFGVEEAAIVFTKAAELRKTYPSIVGIGIGGDEARGPAQDFKLIYEEAKAAGLHLTAHAGENVSAQSIWAAINIGAERIGHALSAVDDPELLDILAEKQIPLELNVTSNLRTGCCGSMEAHPVRHYFERGLMITLNSDDPPMFGADLLDEYETVHREFEFTFEQMREIAGNSVEASFLPPTLKLKLLAEVEQYR